MSIAHPGVFEDLLPYIRYEVMRAGGVDLGVVDVLREPVPESFDAAVLRKGAREARAHYKAMFRDVDAAIMMPGANTSHPAYLAMQDWLKDDLTEHRGRRTIHFHWIENGSAYPIAGQPLPSRAEMDAHLPARAAADRLPGARRHRAPLRRRAEDRRRPHHLARRHRPALPRRRSPREPAGRRRVGRAHRAGQGARRSRNRAAGRRRPGRAARRHGGRRRSRFRRRSGTAGRSRA